MWAFVPFSTTPRMVPPGLGMARQPGGEVRAELNGGLSLVYSLQSVDSWRLNMNIQETSAAPWHASSERIRTNRQPTSIEIEREDEVWVVRFKGDFRTGEDPDYLNAKLDDVKALSCAKVLADFREAKSIGSAALTFIVGLYRISEGCFVLVGAQPRVRLVLDLTRLSTMFPTLEDLESGLAALRSERFVDT
jgi:anti-anti-sigma factor